VKTALMLALLLSCSPAPDPLAGARAALDSDGDGRVGPQEYRRAALRGPRFSEVDLDGDGDLGPRELSALVRSQDPMRYAFERSRSDRPPPQDPVTDQARRHLRDLLGFLQAELAAAAPGALPLDPDLLARARRVDDPETVQVLEQLRAGYAQAGLPFPLDQGSK